MFPAIPALIVLAATPVSAAPAPPAPRPGPSCRAIFLAAESRFSDSRNAELTIIVASAADNLARHLSAADAIPVRADNAGFLQCVRRHIASKADRALLRDHPPF